MNVPALLALLPLLTCGHPLPRWIEDHSVYKQWLEHNPMYNRSIMTFPPRTHQIYFCLGKPPGFHSLGPCKNYHAICDHHNELTIAFCPQGQIYRHQEGRCVEHSSEPWCSQVDQVLEDTRCADDNQEVIALKPCSYEYGVCHRGVLYTAECSAQTDVFSDEYGTCIPIGEHPKCFRQVETAQPMSMEYKSIDSVCDRDSGEKDDDDDGDGYFAYLGPCNQKYMYCNYDGTSHMIECPKDHVAGSSSQSDDDDDYDTDSRSDSEDEPQICVPASQSRECPQNWGHTHYPDIQFIHQMNLILNGVNYCKSRPNGLYFYGDIQDCHRAVIFCFKGKATFNMCPQGEFLDSEGYCKQNLRCGTLNMENYRTDFLTNFGQHTQQCERTPLNGVTVYEICPNFHTHCVDGRLQIESCENPRDMFDVQSRQCRQIYQSDHCNLQEIPDPPDRCSDPAQTDKFVSLGPCEREFSICLNGFETKFPCEKENYAFDQESSRCIPKAMNPKCPEYQVVVHPEPEPEPEPEPAPTVAPDLTCEGDGGFFQHPDCTKFYRCAHGRLVAQDCGPGTAFDISINVCNHKHLVKTCT